MPTTYAHYSFGERVRASLEGEVGRLISENLPLYHIGLHGPDILFYHNPLTHDFINELGHEIHRQTGSHFFSRAKTVLKQKGSSGPATAYLLGVLCHFMLDTECHPLVRQMEKEERPHNQIETAFDGGLMERDGLDPMSYHPTKHIKPNAEYAAAIFPFYEGVNQKQIQESLRSMRRALNLFVSPGTGKRFFVITGMKVIGQYENLKGLLMERNPDPGCKEQNRTLLDAYEKAVPQTVLQLNRFFLDLQEDGPLDQRLDRNFG